MKDLPNAKQRLSSVLSKEERIGLVNAMLGDVLAALAKAETIDAVNIIAHDQNFSEFNVGFIQEAKNAGYNEAVGFALECAEIADASAVLVLPGDIPLVRASEINALAAKPTDPTVRIAGAREPCVLLAYIHASSRGAYAPGDARLVRVQRVGALRQHRPAPRPHARHGLLVRRRRSGHGPGERPGRARARR